MSESVLYNMALLAQMLPPNSNQLTSFVRINSGAAGVGRGSPSLEFQHFSHSLFDGSNQKAFDIVAKVILHTCL